MIRAQIDSSNIIFKAIPFDNAIKGAAAGTTRPLGRFAFRNATFVGNFATFLGNVATFLGNFATFHG